MYLEHHGILGMKWGVRRFQNKDGSLTALGKKKLAYDKADSQYKKDYANASKKVFTSERISSRRKASKSYLKRADAAAEFEAAKHTDPKKAEKAMIKSYMRSNVLKDELAYEADFYDHLSKTRGKEFINKMEKYEIEQDTNLVKALIGGTALIYGSAFVAAYLSTLK